MLKIIKVFLEWDLRMLDLYLKIIAKCCEYCPEIQIWASWAITKAVTYESKAISWIDKKLGA